MAFKFSCVCCLLLLLVAAIPSRSQLLTPSLSCGCNETGAVGPEICDSMGQCICKPGVAGMSCDACIQGYADLTPQGCRNLSCPPRVTGEMCGECSFGYSDLTRGCTPCPACFAELAAQLSAALDLYLQLLTQLNSTLSSEEGGGVNPIVLARIEGYRQILEAFLQRARDAIQREGVLTSIEDDFSTVASNLGDEVDRFLQNLTAAETRFTGLEESLNNSIQFSYNDIIVGVADLEGLIRQELRQLLEMARMLSQQLIDETLPRLMQMSSEAEFNSLDLQMQAVFLVEQIERALINATKALDNLQETINIQNQTSITIGSFEELLLGLEALVEEGREGLGNATRDVPIAVSESSRVLADVLRISLGDFDLSSRTRDVEEIEEELSITNSSLNDVLLLLSVLERNVSLLNTTALQLLTDSRSLTDEALALLARSQEALLVANDSTVQGNRIISEANTLLDELRLRFSDAGNLSAGLEEVLRNLNEAEIRSLMAEEDAAKAEEMIRGVAKDVNMAVILLEGANQRLSDTLALVTELNFTSAQLRTDSIALDSKSAGLRQEVTMDANRVDQLEQAVIADKDATAMVTETATNTINEAQDISERLITVNNVIANLTLEFNETSLLDPSRLQDINATVVALETKAELNEVRVNQLTGEIQRLQDSSEVLRSRYNMLQQHRDLLQRILANIEPLNCRAQFQA